MRLILYTGKGGVGKSSIAAATAVRTADLGRRTLLVSSDMAHNLSDILDRRIGGEPVEIAENLVALEVDPLREIRDQWDPVQDYFAHFLAYLGMDNAVAEEVVLIPGLDEFFLLTRILREVRGERYDVVVVDCSPTAGTLRILTFSDSACTKFNKLLEIERKVMKLARPFAHRIEGGRAIVPDDEVYSIFEELIEKVGELGGILKDPEVSSVRLVLNPDRIALAETRRAFTYFGLFGFPVDAIIVNKVLPNALEEGYLHDWFTLQQDLLEAIDQSFLDVTKFRAPLLEHEPVGVGSLGAMARDVFEDAAPDDMLSRSQPVSIDQVDGKARLTFRLPDAEKEEVDVGRKDTELILRAGGYTRVFSLPDSLADREVAGAEFNDGALVISFE